MSVLRIEKSGGIATLTFDRPDKLNALSRELRAAVEQGLRELQADPDVRVLIVTGAGRAFCAGLDLVERGGRLRRRRADDPGLRGLRGTDHRRHQRRGHHRWLRGRAGL